MTLLGAVDKLKQMEQKQRFFIYDRREMAVLLLLGVMVAVFAFTLGVHLGKRVGGHAIATGPGDAETVPTVPDKIPNRQELTEQAKGAQQAADESLNQALHDEVARTGIRLDTPRQLALPEKPIARNGGATTGSPPVEMTDGKEPAAAQPADKAAAPAATEPEKAAAEPRSEAKPENDAVALHRQAPAGRYTIQIGSFPVLEEARDQADSLEALGLKPYMRQATVRGKVRYRLFFGGYDSRETADKAGKRYVSQHMIEAYVVSKRVDEPAASE